MTGKSLQRPRILRATQPGETDIDEKIATFFVDKAIRAITADLAADGGIEASLRRHGHSLGNVIGQQRFMDRMARHQGCSTVRLSAHIGKKRFLMIRDMLYVDDNRLTITRTVASRKQRRALDVGNWEPFVISRHALIRAVQRIRISSVEDVFRLMKFMWAAVERLMLPLGIYPVTTAGTTCWVLPMMLDETRIGLLAARPDDSQLGLVTVYLPHMIPERLTRALDDFQQTLADKTIDEKERSDRLLAILPRLVV